MSAYFDTSALFKLAVLEIGADVVTRAWDAAGEPFASRIGHVELHAALGQARRSGRDLVAAPSDVDVLWGQVTPVEVDEALVRRAGGLAIRHGLSALDAIHLASALVIAAREPTMAFVTFDMRLRKAAAAEGFLVLPVVA